ncbi:glutaredoxin family protein [Crenothrix polyspora]|jgi:glutaredoxin|uniref:Glutaredoxin domain-containing protein n=1 Tax=Crenothrix polyspora TaxID=360316 RepID=A0A1R4H7D1_9GAMM|nr:glutaredoxin family protein [Crenothrix polyspora]SJM92188.1 hypothetical protein CRENPOLYSF1_250008 [Crenothrix polyspora]
MNRTALNEVAGIIILTALCAAATTTDAKQLQAINTAAPSSQSTDDIVLYTAVWCAYCKEAIAHLTKNGYKYRSINIDSHEGMAAFAQASGNGVPLLLVGKQRVEGFSKVVYNGLLTLSAKAQ